MYVCTYVCRTVALWCARSVVSLHVQRFRRRDQTGQGYATFYYDDFIQVCTDVPVPALPTCPAPLLPLTTLLMLPGHHVLLARLCRVWSFKK